jgi:hypothetical protein
MTMRTIPPTTPPATTAVGKADDNDIAATDSEPVVVVTNAITTVAECAECDVIVVVAFETDVVIGVVVDGVGLGHID